MERVHLPEPTRLGALPRQLSRKVGDHRIPPQTVTAYDSVQFIGPNGWAMDRFGRVILEEIEASDRLAASELFKLLRDGHTPVRLSASEELPSPLLSLVGPWADGYYHWFSDYLPRIPGFESYLSRSGSEGYLLIPSESRPWMLDSLDLLGWSEERRIRWQGDRCNVDTLVVPTIPKSVGSSKGYMHSPQAYRELASDLRAGFDQDVDPDQGPDRILISREDASDRRIENRPVVQDLLSDRGFATRTLEGLSISEQIALFSGVEAIVAPHGAGLVNMMFADDSKVLELFGERVNECYYTMAASLGFDYGFLECEPVGDDMRVDADELERMLDQLGR
jgi:capsular polysaccharide biosynthesis protein